MVINKSICESDDDVESLDMMVVCVWWL